MPRYKANMSLVNTDSQLYFDIYIINRLANSVLRLDLKNEGLGSSKTNVDFPSVCCRYIYIYIFLGFYNNLKKDLSSMGDFPDP